MFHAVFNIKQLTSTTFSAAKPRVIFTSSSLLTPKGKKNPGI